jgi:hypothetical protein
MIKKQDEFNGLIKAIFTGGKINPINWGGENESKTEGWNSWTTEEKLEFSMELASAMNQAAEIMQNERNDMVEKVRVAEELALNAQTALEIQKAIVFTTLTEDNLVKQDMISKIQKLEKTVRDQKKELEVG